MNVISDYTSGFDSPYFQYENERYESEQKLNVLNQLFENSCIGFVDDNAKNLILDKKLQKFSSKSLESLYDDLQGIFNNRYEDSKRCEILEKFLDANESDWPILLDEVNSNQG